MTCELSIMGGVGGYLLEPDQGELRAPVHQICFQTPDTTIASIPTDTKSPAAMLLIRRCVSLKGGCMRGVEGAVGGLLGFKWVWECLRYRGG